MRFYSVTGANMKFVVSVFLCLATIGSCYIVDPREDKTGQVLPTRGEVWPKPQEIQIEEGYYAIKTSKFHFNITGKSCLILQAAVQRYTKLLESSEHHGNILKKHAHPEERRFGGNFRGRFKELKVHLTTKCDDHEYPSDDMQENYNLEVEEKSGEGVLNSETIWGILRGLETFSQLVYLNEQFNMVINVSQIIDFPRFSHRGLLLDTSRHFIPVSHIYHNLDAMAYNKLNVFHWHIVDDQSFPYQSIKFPELSEKGAFHPLLQVYSQKNVADIIEFARLRGIRVIPEFDTPGHTRSWGKGVKDILTPCYENNEPSGKYGPMDPSKPNLYEFLDKFFLEIKEVFPDPYIHIGGDEVEYECWSSNPNLREFMNKTNLETFTDLESYYINKLLKIFNRISARSIVWEEVYTNGIPISDNTIVHVWKGDENTTLESITNAGKSALLSSCWYLDHLQWGGDWKKFYDCEPRSFTEDVSKQKLVLGGEACMWAESVNEQNIIPRIWPRASAAAEKLWSARDADNSEGAARRLEEHACRMNSRGVAAQPPNGPGFCL